ncbi:MAG: CDP-glucose 4,6-dehydratase [Legionellales bacterium]|nr:CDP-glucose 4,6-dehydratase [Legionellales bacterium]
MFNHYFNQKKVLVLGHTGFKGAWLSQWLVLLGAKVIGVSKDIPTKPSLFETLKLSEQIEDHRCDIRDLESLKTIFEAASPDLVFHLAAQPIVNTSYQSPVETFETNVMGTVHVMEAIRQTPSIHKAIIVTSDKCYHNEEWSYGYRESDRLGGQDPYSASKASAEIAFHAYFQSFFKGTHQYVASVRAGNVIGGGDWAAHRIVPDCMRAWAEKAPVVIRSPLATRPWQHVLEPLSGYLDLATQLDQTLTGNAYNFGPDASVNASVSHLIQGLAQYWPNANIQIDKAGAVHHEAGLLKLSCDKALHDLGWQPTLELAQTIQLTSQWYLENTTHQEMLEITQDQIAFYQDQAKNMGQAWALDAVTT